MTAISKDTDWDQVSCLQSATILMLVAPIIMILALFSLYFLPINIAAFISLALCVFLINLEFQYGVISYLTVSMTIYYIILSIYPIFSPDISWLAYSIVSIYFLIAALIWGMWISGRPFTLIYSRGIGFVPLHNAMSIIWGSLHLMSGVSAFVLMPHISFIFVPFFLMLVGIIGTFIINFITMGPRYGRQKFQTINGYSFIQVQTEEEYDLFYSTIAASYVADLQCAAGPKRKIFKDQIEAEHRASDDKRRGHFLPFLVFDKDKAIGGICLFLDHGDLGLPIEHEAKISFDRFRKLGRVAEIGRLGIVPQYRMKRNLLTVLFKCAIEAAAEHRVCKILNDSFSWQVKTYSKIGFVPIPGSSYVSEQNSSGYGFEIEPLFLNLADMILLKEDNASLKEVQRIMNDYVMERFFKILFIQNMLRGVLKCFSPLFWFSSLTRNLKESLLVIRKFLKFIARCWLSFAAIALTYSLVTACSPVNNSGSLRIERTSLYNETDRLRLGEARNIWLAEKGEHGDPFVAGKAAYDIAQLTKKIQWSNEAIELLYKAREQMPQFSLATAYLGSAHALAARDYPLQGLWQILPGPGFIRMHHVNKAKALLNEAVEQDPENPVVRLLRAATVMRMPSVLVDHDTALADFELLIKWEDNPDTNLDFADVLGSVEWRQGFYSNYAEVLSELGKSEQAKFYHEKLKSLLEENKK